MEQTILPHFTSAYTHYMNKEAANKTIEELVICLDEQIASYKKADYNEY